MNRVSNIIVSILAGLALVQSCNAPKGDEWPETVTLSKSVKENTVELIAELYGKSLDFIHARYFLVYKDSLMVVVNNQTADYFIEIYDMCNDRMVLQTCRKGNGPEEFLLVSAYTYIRGSHLVISDAIRLCLKYLDLEDPNAAGQVFLTIPIQYTFATEFNGKYLILNPYCFKDEETGIDNKAGRFLVYDPETGDIEGDTEARYFTYNVAQGRISPGRDGKTVAFASSGRDFIEVYDADLKPVKKIIGPDNLTPQYCVKEDGSICYNRRIPHAYRGLTRDEGGHLYLTYVGDYYSEDRIDNSCIFEFDEEYNFVESYRPVEPMQFNAISVSGDGFWVSGKTDMGLTALFKLKM